MDTNTVAYERGNIETFKQPGFGDHSFMIMGYSSGNNGETRGVSISADKIDVSPMALAIDFSRTGIHSASKDFNLNLLGETYCKTHEQHKESFSMTGLWEPTKLQGYPSQKPVI